MTALSTAEAALRRMPDDPKQPVTLSGAEAAALVRELDGLRAVEEAAQVVARDAEWLDAEHTAALVAPTVMAGLDDALEARDA